MSDISTFTFDPEDLIPEEYTVSPADGDLSENQEYTYHVCEFCLSPPCKDCLPYDYSPFYRSEIPLFFPYASERSDGILDVHKHPNCRCTLEPNIENPVSPEEMETLSSSEDAEKREAQRLFRLAQAQKANKYDELQRQLTNEASSQQQEDAEIKLNMANAQKQHDIFGMMQAEEQTKNQVPTAEIGREVENQIAKLNPRWIRGIYSLRSPMAAARVASREGIHTLGEAGFLGEAAGMSAAITPLIFFMLLPQLEKLIGSYVNNYMQQQALKQQRIFNDEQQKAMRNAFRSIIPA